MDKISGILPKSARFINIDTSRSPAARPGSSTLGRTDGLITQNDRVSISSGPIDSLKNELEFKKPYLNIHEKIKKNEDSFFINKNKLIPQSPESSAQEGGDEYIDTVSSFEEVNVSP